MASNLFDEDVVRRTHRGTVQFGLVLANYEGYSSLEDSDDEEDTIKKGHVRVAWYPKGREEVVPENKVQFCFVAHTAYVTTHECISPGSRHATSNSRHVHRSTSWIC